MFETTLHLAVYFIVCTYRHACLAVKLWFSAVWKLGVRRQAYSYRACAVTELLPVLPPDAQDDISGNSEDSYEAQSVPFHACGAPWIRINSCLNFGPLWIVGCTMFKPVRPLMYWAWTLAPCNLAKSWHWASQSLAVNLVAMPCHFRRFLRDCKVKYGWNKVLACAPHAMLPFLLPKPVSLILFASIIYHYFSVFIVFFIFHHSPSLARCCVCFFFSFPDSICIAEVL